MKSFLKKFLAVRILFCDSLERSNMMHWGSIINKKAFSLTIYEYNVDCSSDVWWRGLHEDDWLLWDRITLFYWKTSGSRFMSLMINIFSTLTPHVYKKKRSLRDVKKIFFLSMKRSVDTCNEVKTPR